MAFNLIFLHAEKDYVNASYVVVARLNGTIVDVLVGTNAMCGGRGGAIRFRALKAGRLSRHGTVARPSRDGPVRRRDMRASVLSPSNRDEDPCRWQRVCREASHDKPAQCHHRPTLLWSQSN